MKILGEAMKERGDLKKLITRLIANKARLFLMCLEIIINFIRLSCSHFA